MEAIQIKNRIFQLTVMTIHRHGRWQQPGEKVIKGQVESMNAVTHSYTIMPIISMAG